jgi:hypothetical protein
MDLLKGLELYTKRSRKPGATASAKQGETTATR